MQAETHDVVVIGAGIAGASAGALLAAGGARVLVLEREERPGYHSTGRSAAMFVETYGPEQVRRLTRASRAFFENPPAGLTDYPLVAPKGEMLIAYQGEEGLLERARAQARLTGTEIAFLTVAEAVERVPILRRERMIGAYLEDGALAIDVDRTLQAWLRLLKRSGGALLCMAEVVGLERRDRTWHVALANGAGVSAPTVVNAAGAWADVIAGLAGVAGIGLAAKRRTGVVVALPPEIASAGWPVVGDLAETFYFKSEGGGRAIVSPADATPVPPQDVQPDELDIAIAIDRFMTATTVEVRRPIRSWAGLRSFTADGDPVIGFAPETEGFFWLAGQGGYGIQTCFGAAALAASLVAGHPLSEPLARFGVMPAALSPARFVVHPPSRAKA